MAKLPAIISTLITTLEIAQQSAPAMSEGDFQYLKLTKSGDWVFGADETEVGNDSVFVIDPASYAQGFIAWDDGSLVAEQMAVAGQPPVLLADLPALPAGVSWDAQVAFAMKGIEGKEDGVQLLYKVSSRGGKGAIGELLSAIIARGKEGNADLCPVILLGSDNYKHKKYGKIYTPVLEIEDWMELPSSGPLPDTKKKAEPEPEPEPAKAKRSRRSRKAA